MATQIRPETTLSQLLQAGCSIRIPEGFEIRGDLASQCVSMRLKTPVGYTASGHYPLTAMGVHVACGDACDFAEMCEREDAADAVAAAATAQKVA